MHFADVDLEGLKPFPLFFSFPAVVIKNTIVKFPEAEPNFLYTNAIHEGERRDYYITNIISSLFLENIQ